MPIIACAAATDHEPCPTGNHLAVCAFVEDIGLDWSDKYQKADHKVVICWELGAKMSDGRPFMISQRYTVSLGEKSNLRGDLESWRGRKFTADELKGFDLEKLIGVNCLLNVIEEERGGKLRRAIASVSPPMQGMPKLTRINTAPPEWVAQARADCAAKMAQHKSATVPFPPQAQYQPAPTTYTPPTAVTPMPAPALSVTATSPPPLPPAISVYAADAGEPPF